jgi:hypothetical protein
MFSAAVARLIPILFALRQEYAGSERLAAEVISTKWRSLLATGQP